MYSSNKQVGEGVLLVPPAEADSPAGSGLYAGLKCRRENPVAATRLGENSRCTQDSAALRPGLSYGRAYGARFLRFLLQCQQRKLVVTQTPKARAAARKARTARDNTVSITPAKPRVLLAEAGQASIAVVLMLSLFLLAVLAFAVDYTNIWFERQQAQTAADAACEAGMMDVYQIAGGATLPNMGFALGAAGNCSSFSSAGPTMCWYASKNGFNGYSGSAANVSWSFPGSVAGITPPPSSIAPYPFMQVSVSLPVKTYFATLITATQTQTVAANATCGLTQVMQGAPIMILHPTMSGALTYSGGGSLTIMGGPPRSIVVNSSSATAVSCASSGVIDTRKGGPNFTGSDVGTYGGPHIAPGSCDRLLWNEWQHRIAGRLQRRDNGTLGLAGEPGAGSLLDGAGGGRHEECDTAYQSNSQRWNQVLQPGRTRDGRLP